MRKEKSIFIALMVLININILFIFPDITSANVNSSFNIVNHQADRYLFNLSNMKPGDWVTRNLTIQNRGNNNFTYKTESKFTNGSEKLYNEFQLKIWDSNGLIFNDKLHKFKGLNPRNLQAGKQEDLKFEVKFPYELGNEFQNLGFDFELRFIIEESNPEPNPGDDSTDDGNEPILPQRPIPAEELDDPPVDGQILPSTATNLYNYLLMGILLVISGGGLFFLQKRKKNLKQDHSRP
ncbi:LPXTG cell wall anchor domain-containing protein [Cytobacillus firmus]|uniref:LPXTG cell wall anchor domain-containing protein n=1 Tax=Cytobacillus firmus TaxID=1399 RepID=UPI002162E97D|nr:LPXTG cell wall anchor domain-containing protein [Cytobacillus firmus]MCS0655691.1 LPXTG cell wall anchor domain-containing protein [Cytobacillus firmus]